MYWQMQNLTQLLIIKISVRIHLHFLFTSFHGHFNSSEVCPKYERGDFFFPQMSYISIKLINFVWFKFYFSNCIKNPPNETGSTSEKKNSGLLLKNTINNMARIVSVLGTIYIYCLIYILSHIYIYI